MVCLDTTFLVDLLRGNEKVKSIKDRIDNNREAVFIATPSIIELMKGLKIGFPNPNEEEHIYELINSSNILNLDKDSAILSGEIEGDLIKKGEKIDLEDIMIAAIAIINNETLITKNEKHFRKVKDLEIEVY